MVPLQAAAGAFGGADTIADESEREWEWVEIDTDRSDRGDRHRGAGQPARRRAIDRIGVSSSGDPLYVNVARNRFSGSTADALRSQYRESQ